MKRDAATERQVQAANPGASTWLSANAGSGKTRVLTDRVARLLLNEVLPQHILCLTYTKAAASEMQNRLFRRLGEWAMLDETKLRKELVNLGLDQGVDDETLRRARRLFARAIETPGGLKIQTIHSFCASLLRRFPLEAGVSPQFVEMDDRAARRLREDIVENLADAPVPVAFDGIARWFTGDDLSKLTGEIAKHRTLLPKALDTEAVFKEFGLKPGFTIDALLAEVFLGSEHVILGQLIPALRAGSVLDAKAAEALSLIDVTKPDAQTLRALEGVFLTGASAKVPFSAKIGTFPTKGTQKTIPDLMTELEQFMARVEGARERRLGLGSAEKSLALHQFATEFLPQYQAAKLRHGWLDFDDLILKARDLLTNPGVAEWVLYRLDGGIDHILVDEAQDTSPVQWQVIDLLAQEFTSGRGARANVERTIFVVGDKKQSIYSFQGADPDGFDRMREHFAERLKNVSNALQELLLEYSFRSSDAVLRTVDCTFHEHARQGLGNEVTHRAFKSEMPGRVDLWPVIEKSEDPEKPHWADPVDTPSPEHHNVRLANRVASEIGRLIRNGETLEDGPGTRRKVRAGDFLILVQRRSALFHEIIRACKSAGLPIAGADRLKVGGELAVKDLNALLSFLATPEDSLSLACALRSPLFGWDEKAIYGVAAGRAEKYLWETLRKQKDQFGDTFETLDALRSDADFLRPYDLIERILTRHDGRRKLIARLGEEAEDGIDALLSQALAYERLEVPSLTGFLTWLSSDEVEIKRQLDSAGDRIRVMTVHGSKGLEAPIVILPDTGKRDIRINDEIFETPDGMAIWKTAKAESAKPVLAANERLVVKQQEERQRLLYVAMTRAEQWLITCAAGDLAKGESWYERIAGGMERAGAEDHDFGFGMGKRVQTGDWSAGELTEAPVVVTPPPSVPDWARARAVTPEKEAPALSPSDLGGAKILPGDGAGLDEEAAKLRGTRLHLLLEHLPTYDRSEWADVSQSLLSGDEGPTPNEIAALLAETETVLTAPALAHLFTADALAEVDVTATLPDLGGQPLHGTIDRLIIEEGRVLAVDYKSNAMVPDTANDVPDGLLRQMGAYAAALSAVFPNKTVETAILWTRTATLMPLPSQLVAQALGRATTS
ncbi:double-strand break repair helicase AddA [Actibacterium lipolyticum]|uniref:DNA 3'-5' helicase n=1 Tax=Actibacterium lipolyticum TaxID=1524263 RepID=A0A238KWQ9_9RHOB|nr:double-strand break repair helicase AddA [Actibacterium lipolyticum]SMX47147.1 ATP-dependent helicase/nuclease subunit A [Actibacterium lipolyticum]